MSFVVPQESRYQVIARVNDAPLAMGAERDMVFRQARQNMVERFAGYVVEKCMRQDSYQGFAGSTLHLDVYVLSANDLHAMLDKAYSAGLRSKERFAFLDPRYVQDTE